MSTSPETLGSKKDLVSTFSRVEERWEMYKTFLFFTRLDKTSESE